MPAEAILLRMARAVLDNVLRGLTEQLNVVEERAMAQIKLSIQEVTGGIWKGQGADAFVNELSSIFIPNVTTIQEHISTTQHNLVSARDAIDRADEESARLVQSRLMDAFSFY
jgi:uncharacterized protein YukE